MPEPADEALILRLIASGLVQVHQVVARGHALRLPYPSPLQRGLDLLTLHCLRTGTTPPAGVPELIRWCHEPLGSWPVPLGGPEMAGDVLLHLGVPTRSCHEWAVPAADVEGELFENEVIAEVRRTCRAAGRPDAYVAFRHLVIAKPVLTDLQFQNEVDTPELHLLRAPLQRCYPPAPAECVVDGMVWCCASCGNLLVQSPQGPECVDDRCPRTRRARPGRALPVAENVRWVAAPVRAFVSSPGRAELRLRDALERYGVQVELWPGFDAYDLRITFPDGQVWAVDVKDWANPVRLARHLRPLPREPRWDRAFLVPSRAAAAAVPGYVRTLRERSRGRLDGSGTEVISEQRLLAQVRAALTTSRSPRRTPDA